MNFGQYSWISFWMVILLEIVWSARQRFRSSRPEVFCKKGVLRNLAKFTGKHLCQSLFFNFEKFLRTPFLTEHLRWLLLKIEKCCISNLKNLLSCFKNVENIRAAAWYRTDWGTEAVARRCSVKKVFLEILKETLGQVFSWKFCEIFKNNFSYRTSPVAASRSSRY